MSKQLQFLTKAQYYDDLTTRIGQLTAGPVVVATMVLQPEIAEARRLLDALVAAARRGLEVTLLVDAINFMVGRRHDPGPLFYDHNAFAAGRLGRFQPLYDALQELQAAGGRVAVLNMPRRRFSNFYAGRSHIKCAVVGSDAYVGGCNLNEPDLLDVMVRVADAALADALYDLAQRELTSGRVRTALADTDTKRNINTETELLVDAGVPKQSGIMERALQAIDAAQHEIWLTTQYFVGGRLGQRLRAAAERGVRVHIVYNSLEKHMWLEKLLVGSMLLRQRSVPPGQRFTERVLPATVPYLHAKVLLADDTVLVGSHNYFPLLVRAGTAEICLALQGSRAAEQAKTFLAGLLHHEQNDLADDQAAAGK